MSKRLVLVAVFLRVIARADLTFTPIAFPGAFVTYARAINNRGDVVGDYIDSSGSRHGFRYESGAYVPFDAPGAASCDTFAWGINDSGMILITSAIGSCSLPVTYVYNNGSVDPVEAPGAAGGTIGHGLNDHGEIVGALRQTYPNTGDIAFLDSAGVFTPFEVPGATPYSTYIWGINDSGAMVGQYADSAGTHAFLDIAGAFTLWNGPGLPSQSVARAISDNGDVVGFAGWHGFLYDTSGFRLFDAPGSSYGTEPVGINDQGQIVGYFTDDAGIHSFLATPSNSSGGSGNGGNGNPPSSIPEPRTLPVLAGFLAVFALAGKKSR